MSPIRQAEYMVVNVRPLINAFEQFYHHLPGREQCASQRAFEYWLLDRLGRDLKVCDVEGTAPLPVPLEIHIRQYTTMFIDRFMAHAFQIPIHLYTHDVVVHFRGVHAVLFFLDHHLDIPSRW